MTFVSILETFAALVVALGGFELIKWVKRTFFPSKKEKRQDEASTKQSEVGAEKAIRDMYEETLKEMREEFAEQKKEMREEYVARINELRISNVELNKTNTELLKAGARKDDIISDKVAKIRKYEETQIQEIKKHDKEKETLIKNYETQLKDTIQSYEEKITCLTKEYEDKITCLTRQLGHQEKLAMFYRSWHCEREYGKGKEDCMRRKPAQEPHLKYCPPELVVTSMETENNCKQDKS